jgi:hypothetical protein
VKLADIQGIFKRFPASTGHSQLCFLKLLTELDGRGGLAHGPAGATLARQCANCGTDGHFQGHGIALAGLHVHVEQEGKKQGLTLLFPLTRWPIFCPSQPDQNPAYFSGSRASHHRQAGTIPNTSQGAERMEIFLFWVIFAVIVAVAASGRGRSGLGWFFLSVFISPLLSFILLMVLPKIGIASMSTDETGRAITPETHVRCPDCKELVRRDARKCKHCGTALIPQ